VQFDRNFASAWARLSRANAILYFRQIDTNASRREAVKTALENAQKLEPNSPETLLALGYYQYMVLRDYDAAEITFERVRKMLPSSSEVLAALARVARRQGHFDQSVKYWEQALAFDPRNVELLNDAARTYVMLRQFSTALRFYDRELDITPNDPEVMAAKAGVYLAQGNLQESRKNLSEINEQSPFTAFSVKINQLTYERNYRDAIQLLQDRLAQFPYDSQFWKGVDQAFLALTKRLASDIAGAKVTAEQARNTLEPLYRDQPGNAGLAAWLSQPYAVMGENDLALKLAMRAIELLPPAKDPVTGPGLEENLAVLQTFLGENSGAISTLRRLLQTSYASYLYYAPNPITPALLRLDPIWDPLRGDPAFQKLCEEKQK